MDTKELIKWGAFIIIGWLALRWLGNLAVNLSAGLSSGGSGILNAPYIAPLTGPQVVYGWVAPWQRPRYGPGKRYGGPGPVASVSAY